MRRISKSLLLSAAPVVALLIAGVQSGQAEGPSGNVYVMTNQSSGNSVMVFHRNAAGTLSFSAAFATGGNGAGTGADPLASQGALVLSQDQRFLFAVNAGSNSVSMFAVRGDRLILLDTVASGGVMPVSIAVRHDLVYVLNAGQTPNISGFIINPENNRLIPLARSTRHLPGGTASAPAQVSFTPDGSALVVTEKGTHSIDTFTLDDGRPSAGVSFPFSGVTPFGFSFGHDDVLIVSDADGGPAATGAVSTYSVDDDGKIAVITPALGDTQKAACWLVVPRNGRFAYTTNAASNSISSYRVSEDGYLTLRDAVAVSTGAGTTPTDMALSDNSQFLYTRNGGNGSVSGFRIGRDGSLTPIASITGVPSGSQGIAAR